MKESIEDIDGNQELDLSRQHKIHVLFGGTKVVQHTPPSKNTSGLRCNYFKFNLRFNYFEKINLKIAKLP